MLKGRGYGHSFYQHLQKEIDGTPRHDLLLVIGDLNAKVGSKNVRRERVMGNNGCGTMNENGSRFADLYGINDFIIGGTVKLSC